MVSKLCSSYFRLAVLFMMFQSYVFWQNDHVHLQYKCTRVIVVNSLFGIYIQFENKFLNSIYKYQEDKLSGKFGAFCLKFGSKAFF